MLGKINSGGRQVNTPPKNVQFIYLTLKRLDTRISVVGQRRAQLKFAKTTDLNSALLTSNMYLAHK